MASTVVRVVMHKALAALLLHVLPQVVGASALHAVPRQDVVGLALDDEVEAHIGIEQAVYFLELAAGVVLLSLQVHLDAAFTDVEGGMLVLVVLAVLGGGIVGPLAAPGQGQQKIIIMLITKIRVNTIYKSKI